ncbi:unnamed protein product, partial [Prorocentrum cordatum]
APPVAAAAPAPPAAAALGVPRRREAAEAVAPRRARLACPPAGRERAGAPRALPRLAGGRGAAAGCAEGRGGREAVRAEGCAVQHGARSAFARGERIHTRALAVGFRGALPQMRGRTGSLLWTCARQAAPPAPPPRPGRRAPRAKDWGVQRRSKRSARASGSFCLCRRAFLLEPRFLVSL